MLNADRAFVNTVTWGTFEHTMHEYHAWRGVKSVKICVAPDSCEPCQALGDRTYPLEDAPTLPCPACTNPGGCRCRVVAVDMDWSN